MATKNSDRSALHEAVESLKETTDRLASLEAAQQRAHEEVPYG